MAKGIGFYFNIIWIITVFIFFYFYVIKPTNIGSQEAQRDMANIEQSRKLDRACLTEIGKEECSKIGAKLEVVDINPLMYKGIFICSGNKNHINISQNYLSQCSNN